VYKYYFYRELLNIGEMTKAAQLFLGEHDFRNFCKLDVIANQNFTRTIYDISFHRVEDPFATSLLFTKDPRLQLYCAVIEGNAFLWHQIRCMMHVLFQVGRGHERPDIVPRLLAVVDNQGKPHYALAPGTV
jgi:tRNA pseudouridine38/39 synthase